MLVYDAVHWWSFLAAAVLLNISPGPDIAFILGRSLAGGTRAGLLAMVGIWTGTLVHVLLAAFGLSAILLASAELFTMIKWAGAAYLIWLGIQCLRSQGTLTPGKPAGAAPLRSVFLQGILVSALNPKVAIFFLAFLPQFVVAGAGPAPLQLAVHGVLIIVVAAVVEPVLVLAAGSISNALQTRPALGRWLDRGLGTLFIGFGLRLGLVRD